MKEQEKIRNLVLVLGDQLNEDSAAFDGFDLAIDEVWMAEAREEATHVWSHKARIVLFLSAMRHFREALRKKSFIVHYTSFEDSRKEGDLASSLRSTVRERKPERLLVVEPGEWRVQEALIRCAKDLGTELEILPDRSFLCSRKEFLEHAEGRKQLRMEFFYREMRRRYGVLMVQGKPMGGRWNFDAENRGGFGKQGPPRIPPALSFPPDRITRQVIRLVDRHYPKHPGRLENFDWPVTPEQALSALEDFIEHRLPAFGTYQDASWTGEPFLFHSLLSSSMNLKLLDPREVIGAAEEAFADELAPLNSAEGFIRQILGWREYVRGIYWKYMPGYLEMNALKADAGLPSFYWTGEVDLNCLREAIGQTLEYGYAHHIQRLMVTGLFALLLGVDPCKVHEWYLAIYVDAVEWVELPNTLGMSQFGDGGLMASKPYVATGKYIQRLSNYCVGCRYDPAQRSGDKACPFTVLYWDFLMRHAPRLMKNPRMRMQMNNLERLDREERRTLRREAERLKSGFGD